MFETYVSWDDLLILPYVVKLRCNEQEDIVRRYPGQCFVSSPIQGLVVIAVYLNTLNQYKASHSKSCRLDASHFASW